MLLAPPCQDRIMLRKWASGLQEEHDEHDEHDDDDDDDDDDEHHEHMIMGRACD